MSHSECRLRAARLESILRACALVLSLGLLAPAAGLAQTLTKSAPADAIAGESFEYGFTIDNDTGGTLEDVDIVDLLPRWVNFAGIVSGGFDCSVAVVEIDPGGDDDSFETEELTCGHAGDLPEDETTLVVEVDVDPSAPVGTFANSAELFAAGGADPVASDSAETEIERSADVELVSRSLPDSPLAAATSFDYALTLINNGPSAAFEPSLTTSLPPGFSVIASSAGWDCRVNTASGRLTCRGETLAPALDPDDTVELDIVLRAPRNPPVPGEPEGSYPFGPATIASPTPDPDSGNDAVDGSASVTVQADWGLTFQKTASNDPIVPGLAFEYEIVVGNAGPSDLVEPDGGSAPGEDLRPRLTDIFDDLLVADSTNCSGLSSEQPCWTCSWRESPQQRQVLDSTQVTSGIGGAWQAVVSPDGAQVFVAGRFDDALASFDRETGRNDAFGTLTADAGALRDEPLRPRALAVSPDGRFLAAATWLADGETGVNGELQLFERDAGGALTLIDRVDNIDSATALVFSPDGRFIYLADGDADAIEVYALGEDGLELEHSVNRDAGTGVLLADVADLEITADGSRLYAAAPGDRAVTGFSLDAGSGEPTPLSDPSIIVVGDVGNVAVEALSLNPAGGELAAGGESAVVFFELAGDGGLTRRNAVVAVEQPPVLLAGVADLVYGANGEQLFVVAGDDRAISRLSRSSSSGEMVFRRSVMLPDAGDDETLIPNGIARDPGGENLYVTATRELLGGLNEPSLSAVVSYAALPPGDCGIDRPEDADSGNIAGRALALPAGQELVVTVFTRLSSAATTEDSPLVNTAELVEFDADDANPPPSLAEESVDIIVATAVDVSHAPGDTDAVVGEHYSFDIEIRNQGPIGLSGLELDHVFADYPGVDGVGFEAGTTGWSCSAEGNACCNPGGSQQACGVTQPTAPVAGSLGGHKVDLGAGSSMVFTAHGRIHPASAPDGSLVNDVELIMPDGVDALVEEDLVDTLSVPLEALADLWLTKERVELVEIGPGNGDWPAGTELVARYAIRAGNRGPSAVAGAVLEDLLDADDALLADDAVWACNTVGEGEVLAETCCGYDGSGTCLADTAGSGALSETVGLAPGGRLLFDLQVPVDVNLSDGILVNEARIDVPPDVVDPDPLGASKQLSTRLAATAELDITKAILAGSAITPGEEVSFEITVTNDGPDDVPVVVEDLLPDDLDNAAWTCDATTPTPGDLIHDAALGSFDLVDTRDVLASPDGRHVYISAAGGPGGEDGDPVPSAIAVYERDVVPGPDFGELLQLEVEIDGSEDPDDAGLPVDGLGGAGRMALSPDARHLYVAAADADAVAVFRREHVSGSDDFGKLAFAESRANGSDQPGDSDGPVSGLAGASDVAVSADGEHVYALGFVDQAVVVFRRDSGTGVLEFQGRLDAFDLIDAGFDGLWGPIDIALSPDDRFVFVTGSGSTTDFRGALWATGEEGERYVMTSSVEVEEDEEPPVRWLTSSRPVSVPDLAGEQRLTFEHRYDFDTGGDCADVGVLEISTDGGETWTDIEAFGAQFTANGYDGQQSGAAHSLSGRAGWCGQSAGFATDDDTTTSLRFDDSLAAGDRFQLRFGMGADADSDTSAWSVGRVEFFDDARPARPIMLDTVADQSGNATVTALERQGDSAEVGFGDLSVIETHALEGAADAAVMDGAGENLYVGSSLDRAIHVYQREPDTGDLDLSETVDSFDPDDPFDSGDLAGLSSLAVSGDGEHLVAGGADAAALTVFRRQPFSGTLEPMQRVRQGDFFDPADEDTEVVGGVAGVAGLAFSSDGQHAFSAAQPGQIGVFRRLAPDPTFGFLEAVFDEADDGFGNEAEGLLGARAVALSDNGRFVYTAASGQIGSSSDSGALVVLERDPATTDSRRHLRFDQALRNQRDGVVGLDGALDVLTLGEDIYVVSERDHAIARFRQLDPDGPDAEVEFVEALFDDQDVDGLGGAAALAANPAGTHVYVASRFDHGVAIFRRDTDTGALDFQGRVQEGEDGVDGLLGANALAVATDGRQLYVAARQSDAVSVFDIDGDELVHRQSFFDGTGGAVLTSPTALAVTRDAGGSEHVLVTSLDGDAVTVLDRETDASLPDLFGRLRFHSVVVDGQNGAEALRGPRDIAVDPDNDRVYVVSGLDDALVILERNTSVGGAQFGRLTPLEVRRQGVGGLVGLSSPYGLVISGGARRNIYTASLGSQSVAAFLRRSGSSCASEGSGSLSEEVFLAADGTVRFVITGTVAPGATGTLSNEATISVPDDVDNTGDTSSFITDPVDLEPFSELSVGKTNDRLSVTAGERQTYRIAIDNAGPSSALDVAISDILDADAANYFDVDSAVWSCRAVGAGLLEPAESLSREGNELPGLSGVAGLSFSPPPDDLLPARVYASGVLGNSLVVIELDDADGAMSIESVLADGDPIREADGAAGDDPVSLDGLRGARGVTVGAGGRFVYVSSQVDNRISVFEVDTADSQADGFGELMLAGQSGPDFPGLASMNQPLDLVLSPDGAQLYAAAAGSSTIHVFDVDAGDGSLDPLQVVEATGQNGLGGVGGLAFAPPTAGEADYLYAAGTNDSALSVLRREDDGTLSHVQTRSSPGTPGLVGIVDIAVDPSGSHVYAVGRDDNALVAFGRNNDPGDDQFGRLASSTVQRLDADDLGALNSPRSVAVSADGGSVYVAAFGSNSLLAFSRDRQTGELSFLTRYRASGDRADLAGVSSLALDASGENLFAGALADSAVTRLRRSAPSRCGVDSGSGNVEFDADIAAAGSILIELEVDVRPDAEGRPCPDSLDPERQCVINRAEIAVDQADQPDEPGDESPWRDSDASFLQRAADLVVTKTDGLAAFRGLADARAVAVTRIGNPHAYVAAPGEPGIGIFALEPDEGGPTGDYPLSFVDHVVNGEDGVSSLNGIGHILVSPDGRHVYAASRLDSSVVAFERDVDTGRLSILAVYNNNAGGVSEMSGTGGLAMDTGGRHLYVVGTNSNAVVVFDRSDESTDDDFGRLTFRQSLQDGTGGVQDMLGPVDLALSDDDRHLYVAASDSDAVVVFRRAHDPDTGAFGELTWLQSRSNLAGGVSGLADVTRVRASADGRAVYATGSGNDSLVWFARDDVVESDQFGRLSFAGRSTEGENGAEGLTDVSDLAMIGDDFLVATSPSGDSLALYQRDAASQALTFVDRLAEGDGAGEGVVSGLAGANAVVAAGSGQLLTAAAQPGSLAVAEIDAGSLAFGGSMIEGQGGAVPGSEVDYVIEVRNNGPSRVVNARLSDQFPVDFESVEWTCEFSSQQSSCPAGIGSGNIDVQITVDAGDTVRFFATAVMRPDASGVAVNEASVSLPAGVVDLDPDTNVARDDDTAIQAVADLAIGIEELPAAVAAGSQIGYRLRVENLGTSNVESAEVVHVPPEAFSVSEWSCSADREPGQLELRSPPPPALATYRAGVVSPDGRHFYAVGDAESGAAALALFDRDGLGGGLAPRQQIENLATIDDPDGQPVVVDGLDDARALIMSPDGSHLYVAGHGDDAVAVFARDAVDGQLAFAGLLRDNIDFDGLAGPQALAMSEDGEQLYVAASLDNAVAVLDRDPATGLLEPAQVRRDNVDGVSDLVEPVDLALSADGSRLLVAARGSDAIVQFARNGDGTLANGPVFADGETVVDGDDSYPLTGLAGVRSLAVAADGATFHALSRDGGEHALVVFERLSDTVIRPVRVLVDGETLGEPAEAISGLAMASSLSLGPDDDQLYAAGIDTDSGLRSVAAFGSPADDDIQFLGRFDGTAAPDGARASPLVATPDGRHLYAVGAGGADIDRFEVLGGSRCARAGRGVVVDRVSLESGGEVVYDITARVGANARGSLSALASVLPGGSLRDPALANNLAVADSDIAAEAAIEVVKTLITDPVVAGEPVTWTIDVTNNGPSTVWGLDIDDSLPTLPGDVPVPGEPGVIAGSAEWMCESTSQLAVVQSLDGPELAEASGAAFSDDGLWAAATGAGAGTLTLYSRNPDNGWLAPVAAIAEGDIIEDDDGDPVGEVSGLAGASDVWFAPDNEFLYVTAGAGNAVSWFRIDAADGALEPAGVIADGDSTGLSLERPERLLADADGERLYVAARDSSAVSVFARDAVTGGLTWLESRRSGIGMPNNVLDGVTDLAISPDQRFVYAAAAMHNGLAIFERSADGTLAYSGRLRNGDTQAGGTVTGLGLVQSIAISGQGEYLYAAALADDSVTLFERDADNGALTLARHYRDGFGGLDDLDGANALALSPDGEHLYVSALNDGVVSVFDRDWDSGEIERIEKVVLPTLAGLDRLVVAPGGGHMLATTDVDSGTLANLLRRPEGFCGIESLQADSLLDTIDLGAGGSLRYTVEALVHPGARGELVNTANAALPQGYTALTPDAQSDSAGGPIEVVTELTMDKTIDGDASSLVAGNEVTFVLDVRNLGPSHAFGAEVLDTLPASLLDVGWTCQTVPGDSAGSSCAAQGGGDLAESVDVLVDERLLYLIDGRIDPAFIGQLENVAEVAPSAEASDPDTGNNIDSIAASVSAAADIIVTKTALADEAVPGQSLAFEIVVDNIGPSDAPQVAIGDSMPDALTAAGWTCTSQGPASCPAADGPGSLDLVASIPADGSLIFEVDTAVADDAATGEVTNSADAEVLGTEVGDPDPASNVDTATVTIVEPLADVSVSKTVDLDSALGGDVLAYEIVVANAGPGVAPATAVIDVMPDALVNVTWSCEAAGGADCPVASGSGDIDLIADLPVDASLTVTVSAEVAADAPLGPDQQIVNEASAVSDADDPDDSNNLDTAVTTLDRHLIFSDRFEAEDPKRQPEDES